MNLCMFEIAKGVLDMKDLHDVDASKPYLSIFVHFRGRHVLQSAGVT